MLVIKRPIPKNKDSVFLHIKNSVKWNKSNRNERKIHHYIWRTQHLSLIDKIENQQEYKTINQFYLIDIYRTFHPKTECTGHISQGGWNICQGWSYTGT